MHVKPLHSQRVTVWCGISVLVSLVLSFSKIQLKMQLLWSLIGMCRLWMSCSWNQPCHQLVSTRHSSITYRTLHNIPLWQCLDHTFRLMDWCYLKSTVFPRYLADEHNLNKRISEEINDTSPTVLYRVTEVLWTKCINQDGCLMVTVFTVNFMVMILNRSYIMANICL